MDDPVPDRDSPGGTEKNIDGRAGQTHVIRVNEEHPRKRQTTAVKINAAAAHRQIVFSLSPHMGQPPVLKRIIAGVSFSFPL